MEKKYTHNNRDKTEPWLIKTEAIGQVKEQLREGLTFEIDVEHLVLYKEYGTSVGGRYKRSHINDTYFFSISNDERKDFLRRVGLP